MAKYKYWIGISCLLVILLASCSGQPAEPVSFNVAMKEYGYEPADLEVKVGQEVTINLENTGLLSHELMFGRNVVHADRQPNGYEMDLFDVSGTEPEIIGAPVMDMSEDEHMHSSLGVMVKLPKTGDAATLRFVVTEDMLGEWEMGCFEQDGVHYTAGMVGKLIVNPR